MNPVTMEVSRGAVSSGWKTSAVDYLPFGGEAKYVTAVVPQGSVKNSSNSNVYTQPFATTSLGSGDEFQINWSEPVKGLVRATVRCDS